jgi:hypothetical protein
MVSSVVLAPGLDASPDGRRQASVVGRRARSGSALVITPIEPPVSRNKIEADGR